MLSPKVAVAFARLVSTQHYIHFSVNIHKNSLMDLLGSTKYLHNTNLTVPINYNLLVYEDISKDILKYYSLESPIEGRADWEQCL